MGASIITPNVKELSSVLGIDIRNEDIEIEKYGKLVRTKYKLKYLLITRSNKGMTLIERNKITHFSTEAKDVYDVSGAGDTVVAVLSACFSIGFNIIESIKIANIAAGIVVSKSGTMPITIEELNNTLYLNEHHKIKNKNKLIKKLKEYKNKKIIFTNGCFDLLHRGHIEYLRKAKELGDILIVGLNSDNSVKKLKGKSRPITNQNDRAEILSSLEFIDFVVIFNEETPYNLIKSIKPDVLVKGGDYKVQNIVGREFAKKTHIIDFVNGYSTTGIIKKK